MQKPQIDKQQITFRNHNVENSTFTVDDVTESTFSLEILTSGPQNFDSIFHTQHMDTNSKETNVTDFHSTLLQGGTMFLSHTFETMSLGDLQKKIF